MENDINPENKYNMKEKVFNIGRDKRRHVIVGKDRKNLHLMQYNLQEFVTIIEAICADETKLLLFIIFRGLSNWIGNFVQAEKEGIATLA